MNKFSEKIIQTINHLFNGSNITKTHLITQLNRSKNTAYQNMLDVNENLRSQSNGSLINLDQMDHRKVMSKLFNQTLIQSKIEQYENNFTKNTKPEIINQTINRRLELIDYVKKIWANQFFANNSTHLLPTLPQNHTIELTYGVRDSLNILMELIRKTNSRLIIPIDTYPVYQQIAKFNGLNDDQIVGFKQLGSRDMDQQLYEMINIPYDGCEFLLIADPHPLNVKIKNDEVCRWLGENENRYLIVDSVYGNSIRTKIAKFPTNQILILNSLSKSHASPFLMGFCSVPNKFANLFTKREEQIEYENIYKSIALLSIYPIDQIFLFQQNIFQKGWKMISEEFAKYSPNQISHCSNYYQCVSKIDHPSVITIPMNCFDRPEMDGNIISCLDHVNSLIENEKISAPIRMNHLIPLENFAKGYSKYTGIWSKEGVESKFPHKMHLLTDFDINIGVQKIQQSNGKNQSIICIETLINGSEPIKVTENTGLGHEIQKNSIKVNALYSIQNWNNKSIESTKGKLLTIEQVVARSMAIVGGLKPYDQIIPRTISILPVSKGCQAKCSFCFSNSSVSSEIKQSPLSFDRVEDVLKIAKAHGSERAVITGGGEPTMIPHQRLIRYIELCKGYFDKVVMITNGYIYSHANDMARLQMLLDLQKAGLSIISISRHGYDEESNTNLMSLRTNSQLIAQTIINNKHMFDKMSIRWVSVLQKNGVDSEKTLIRYLNWVKSTGINQICFKELYVAVSEESVYYDKRSNEFSRLNQVPLTMVVDYLENNGGKIIGSLPWGSPIYQFIHDDHPLKIACYTEPSLYWERKNGICRSWNLMADGTVLVSLETNDSKIDVR